MGTGSKQTRHIKKIVNFLNSIKTFVATYTKRKAGHWLISMEYKGEKKAITASSTPKSLRRTQQETIQTLKRILRGWGITEPVPDNLYTLSKPNLNTNSLGQPIEDVWKMIYEWEKSVEEGEEEDWLDDEEDEEEG